MNGLALCAGLAGLELALRIAEPGYRPVCFVEREVTAAAALVARMEEEELFAPAPVWDDVATFDGRPWRGLVDIVSGGYPCQGESIAGLGRGVDDPRWVWPHFARIIDEVDPEWCFFENVDAHLSRSFRIVLGELQDMGYRVAAGLFTAAETGARHQRRRLFILAHRGEAGGVADTTCQYQREPADEAVAVAGSGQARHEPRHGGSALADAGGAGLADAELDREPGAPQSGMRQGAATGQLRIPHVADAHGGGWWETELRQPAERQPDQCLAAVADGYEDLPGLPLFAPGPAEYAAWTRLLAHHPEAQPTLRRAADEPPTRVERLHALGNGVHPLAGALAYRTLRAALLGLPVKGGAA